MTTIFIIIIIIIIAPLSSSYCMVINTKSYIQYSSSSSGNTESFQCAPKNLKQVQKQRKYNYAAKTRVVLPDASTFSGICIPIQIPLNTHICHVNIAVVVK